MVAERVELEPLGDLQAGLTLDVKVVAFAPCVHAQLCQTVHYSGKTVGFLHTKLPYLTEHRDSMRVRRHQRQHGDLVDDAGDLIGRHLATAQVGRIAGLDDAVRLLARRTRVRDADLGAHALERAHEADAGRVQADVLDLDRAFGAQNRRACKERRRRRVARHEHLARLRLGGTGHAGRAGASRGCHAVFGQHELGMIAAWRRLVDRGGSRGVHAGKQNSGLELGRCHGGIIGERAQPAAVDGDGQRLAAFGKEACAHLHERRGDAAHRALAQRGIARERDLDIPRRQNAHEQAHRGAGVAAIHGLGGLAGTGGAPAGDAAGKASVGLLLQADLGAKRVHGPDGAAHVGGIQHAGHARSALRHSGEQHGAVADGLVARHARGAVHGAFQRFDDGDAIRHGCAP